MKAHKTEQGTYTLGEIAKRINAKPDGDPECKLSGLATLAGAGPGDVSFYANPAYRKQLESCRASAIILTEEHAALTSSNKLIVADPYVSFALATQLFAPAAVAPSESLHPSAVIADTATLGKDVIVSPHVVIEAGAQIGERVQLGAGSYVGAGSTLGADSFLYNGVTLYHDVHIGQRAIIHSGAVIGADGFGFAFDGKKSVKIHQLGGVRIGDDVEIGACTSIDRGTIEDTLIGDDVKIDNQVQIGHNCRIGAHSIICGCAGLSGSVTLGEYCIMGGASGAVGHISLADKVQIGAMALVRHSITEPGKYTSGTGHMKMVEWKRSAIRFQQLDSITRRLRKVEKEIIKATDKE
ncbi:MAG: UDP-3-O-(3-hydroxymyristoyl)glucosamine N-acyltransferase [Pseudohongiellaceae bacterium]